MIAERAIIGMLLNGHNLYAVVAVVDDARQNVLLELGVGAHLLGILSHANVALVDEEWVGLGFESLLFPLIGCSGFHTCAENILVWSSCTTRLRPCRNTLAFATIPVTCIL